MNVARGFRGIVAVGLVLIGISTAAAKYSGGTGEPNDPYQIATAGDLIALGETPDDYDKHFILTADIDLDPNLPGGRVFDKAVIAPDVLTRAWPSSRSNKYFTGVLEGDGHTIRRLTITGEDYLGLFGELGSGAEVRNLAVVDANIAGSGMYVGGLVGLNDGRVTACYVTGVVRGDSEVGGFVGGNYGTVFACYAQAKVSGTTYVGGFAGTARGTIKRCYATGEVVHAEEARFLGGFSGAGGYTREHIEGCLWDAQTSGIGVSSCGIGFDTAELTESEVYSLNGWAGDPNWVLAIGQDYPRLAWEGSPGQAIAVPVIDGLAGSGTAEDPYRIATAEQLARIGTASILWDRAFVLTADLDVNGAPVRRIGICPGSDFRGKFDGDGHTIRNLTMNADGLSAWQVGLFGWVHAEGQVTNLILEQAVIRGGEWSRCLGALAGFNEGVISSCQAVGVFVEAKSSQVGISAYVGGLAGCNQGSIDHCRTTGDVRGDAFIGGLVGFNYGASILRCSADVMVSGKRMPIGGLVGANASTLSTDTPFTDDPAGTRRATIEDSCATGDVVGDPNSSDVGGLVGANLAGDIVGCYATGAVGGGDGVGGLVADNRSGSTITNSYARGDVVGRSAVSGLVGGNSGSVSTCYATGKVTGDEYLGGLVGWDLAGEVNASFWDTETSGQADDGSGMGKTTAEVQTASTFLEAGWDFVDETANGTEDVWWIEEGKDYPRLWWEPRPGVRLPVIKLDPTTFDAGIAEGVVLVDFFATWCSHCVTQAFILEEVADRLEGKAQVAKLDIDKARSIAQQYGVTGVPTLILFQDGVEVQRFVGVTGADVLVEAILAVVDSM